MAKIDMTGGEPKTVWSLNLNTAQLVLGFVARLAGAAILVWGMVQWSAGYVFKQELQRFHKEAVPQIERMIDSRVQLQDAQSSVVLADRLDEINQRLARIEGQLARGMK
jgi:hypothetical protein